MGLDQYAWKRKVDWADDYKSNHTYNEQIMYWRKHSKLQQWYSDSFGIDTGEVYLHKEHLDELEELTRGDKMPDSDGGFFYGHQFQDDPEHKELVNKDTLEFIKKARVAISEGYDIIYECSW